MAILKCPECENTVSDKAAACPHCGYGVAEHFLHAGQSSALTIKCPSCSGSVSSLSSTCQYCGSHVAPPAVLHQSQAAEKEFKDAALKIVGTCEQALNSPRMMMNSIVADARSQLDRLVAGHERLLLFTPKYDKVHPYLFACIARIEEAKFQDNQAGNTHGLGGFAGGILGFVADLSTQSEIDYAKAYMHDLRIILGASYGSPTAVQDLEDRDARDARESCEANDATGHYGKPAPQTFSDAQKAISAIGKVTSSNIGDYTINGKVQYGLQSVKLRVTIHPNGATSNVVAEAESDDLWNAGGESVVNRFFEALNRSNDPTYVPDRLGMSMVKLIAIIALFLAIVLLCLNAF